VIDRLPLVAGVQPTALDMCQETFTLVSLMLFLVNNLNRI